MSVKPVRLDEISLRGWGSYLEGARLEIRPLTIICGPNGAGKSTWFRAINLLRLSRRKNLLPFFLADDPKETSERCSFLNNQLGRHVRDGESARREGVDFSTPPPADADADREFGPLGTIGLRACVTRELTLPKTDFDPDGVAEAFGSLNAEWTSFLRDGRLASGTKIRMRLTHWRENHVVELRLGEDLEIRFVGVLPPPLDEKSRDNEEARESLRSEVAQTDGMPSLYRLTMRTATVTTSGDAPLAHVRVERGTRGAFPSHQSPTGGPLPPALYALAIRCVQRTSQVLDAILRDFFFIGAIRQVQRVTRLPRARNATLTRKRAPSRYVGSAGQFTHHLSRSYAPNVMRQSHPPFEGHIRAGTKFEYQGPYIFTFYYGWWLQRLLGIRLWWAGAFSLTGGELQDHCKTWANPKDPPGGFLANVRPSNVAPGRTDFHAFYTSLFAGRDFTGGVAPAHLSSGFHQLAPLIVQAGLMRRHEIMAVENPEVHLHPRLQLDLAEFFIRAALDGKCVIVETHSDLLVRRVLRALRAEEIPQEQVRIFFASVQDDPDPWGPSHKVATSQLAHIRLDEKGQIANWPPGFLTDDVAEARDLLIALSDPDGEETDGDSDPDPDTDADRAKP